MIAKKVGVSCDMSFMCVYIRTSSLMSTFDLSCIDVGNSFDTADGDGDDEYLVHGKHIASFIPFLISSSN